MKIPAFGASASFHIALLLQVLHLTKVLSHAGNPCRVLGFYPKSDGKRLENHIIQIKTAGSEDFCQALCYMDINCRSINFRRTKDNEGTHLCELNDADKDQHPDDLKNENDFSYRGTKSPCTSNPCKGNATCQTGFGPKGYRCVCPAGYTGSSCEKDIDECKSNPCHTNAKCANTQGSYFCNCSIGYQGNGSHCEDVNECDYSNSCHVKANCINSPGSYVCNCSIGYQGNGSQCEDINECDESSSCHANAKCTNTPGSYFCRCSIGYQGNGSQCEDINECNISGSCHANANCMNTLGSYVCDCSFNGYEGNGSHCEDIDECSKYNPCHLNANCTNTQGSYFCTCFTGYQQNGIHCEVMTSCQDILTIGVTQNGVYTIIPDAQGPLNVYCDQTTDSGGWTVVQRRISPFNTSFNRAWEEYRIGFGNLTGEFWLGNDNIHRLAATPMSFRIDWERINAQYARYESFTVAGAADKYRWKMDSYLGSLPNAIYGSSIANVREEGMQFSSPGNDNDGCECECAASSGWWLNHCGLANLNYHKGPYWAQLLHWPHDFMYASFSEMKVRP